MKEHSSDRYQPNQLTHLLVAENKAKWLRREKLDDKLEAVNAVDPLSMTLGNITEPRKKNVFLDSRLFSL